MKNNIWQLQEAKNRLSELVNKAIADRPQIVTHHGKELVVVISKAEYNRLRKSQTSLLEFFRQSPLVGVELDLKRDQRPPGDIDR